MKEPKLSRKGPSIGWLTSAITCIWIRCAPLKGSLKGS